MADPSVVTTSTRRVTVNVALPLVGYRRVVLDDFARAVADFKIAADRALGALGVSSPVAVIVEADDYDVAAPGSKLRIRLDEVVEAPIEADESDDESDDETAERAG